eukprot:3426492-Amphidinium_carterae.1
MANTNEGLELLTSPPQQTSSNTHTTVMFQKNSVGLARNYAPAAKPIGSSPAQRGDEGRFTAGTKGATSCAALGIGFGFEGSRSCQDTSREVKVRSPQFCVEDVQTLGSTMLIELRMRDDELRAKAAKQLVIHSSTPKPQAAAESYEADCWTPQEWASDHKGRQAQDKKKICSAYASKDGCPKGAMCYMVAKGGHPRMKDKCLQLPRQ